MYFCVYVKYIGFIRLEPEIQYLGCSRISYFQGSLRGGEPACKAKKSEHECSPREKRGEQSTKGMKGC